MPTFTHDAVEIAYIDEGPRDGEPILLIHGFASNHKTNWVDTIWVRALTRNGRRVIAMDNRGHGASTKLYGHDDYGSPLMAEDARRLLDHLGIQRADVMGYSMGARITAFLALAHPNGCGVRFLRGSASIWCAGWPARGRLRMRWKRTASTM